MTTNAKSEIRKSVIFFRFPVFLCVSPSIIYIFINIYIIEGETHKKTGKRKKITDFLISDFALVVKNCTPSTKVLIINELQNLAFQDWCHFD